MITSLKKNSTIISLLFLLFLFVVAWFYPSLGLGLGTILLVLTLAMACIAVLQKHRKSHLQGEITYFAYMRNVALEISGIILAMLCAAYFGNYIALLATQSIDDILMRFAAGVFVGLLVGMVIGSAVRQVWSRFLKPLKQQYPCSGRQPAQRPDEGAVRYMVYRNIETLGLRSTDHKWINVRHRYSF